MHANEFPCLTFKIYCISDKSVLKGSGSFGIDIMDLIPAPNPTIITLPLI